MPHVISFERALAEGATRAQLISIARWHEHRAESIRKKLKGKDRARVAGEMLSTLDVERHLGTADALWDVADRLGYEPHSQAA